MCKLSAQLGTVAYRTEIVSDKHVIFSDEPLDLGGGDTAFTPFQLMLSSLASCTLITMRMYANRKGWRIDTMSVDLFYNEETKEVKRNIRLEEADENVMKERMLLIANKCPIHKLLDPVLQITTTLV